MGDHLIYLRYHWFDQQIRRDRYPNAPAMARNFEIDERTARRAIEAMRRDFDAPLAYSSIRRGFYYSDESFRLPEFWVSQEEILALLLARNLLSCCAEGLISKALGAVSSKLASRAENLGLSAGTLDQSFSAAWLGYSPAQAEVFRLAARAVLDRRLLSFHYLAPDSKTASKRLVEPHHLQHYMGTWVLLAWCRTRHAWRKFLLSRMEGAAMAADNFQPRARPEWEQHLQGAFGIFQGPAKETAVVRFTPERGRRIREQVWHPDQRLDEEPDGHLRLTLPVADYREIKLRLLQYGAEAEVLAPAGLRAEIRREAARLAELYGFAIEPAEKNGSE